MSINKFIGIGNVGQDPEIRATKDGKEIASLNLAMTESWKDKQGDKQERTEWVKVSIFGGLVNVVKNYVHKGSKLYIEGALQTVKYTDKNGIEKYVTKVVIQGFNSTLQILGSKESINQANNTQSQEEIPY